jgi:hypothetical protein
MRKILALLFWAVLCAPAQSVYDRCAEKIPVPISIASTTGSVQVVPPNPARPVTVCSIAFNADTAGAIKLVTGTGTNCGTGATDFTGAFQGASGLVLGPFLVPAAKALCINFSATVNAGGAVSYVP